MFVGSIWTIHSMAICSLLLGDSCMIKLNCIVPYLTGTLHSCEMLNIGEIRQMVLSLLLRQHVFLDTLEME